MKMIKKIADFYRNNYYIPLQDLGDFSETNRIHSLVIGSMLFFVGILDLVAIIFIHHSELEKYFVSLIYFGIFTIIGLFSSLFSLYSKRFSVRKERRAPLNFLYKNITVYLLIFTAFSVGIYNFYILDQRFNGVLICVLSGFLALFMFSFSPIPFLFVVTVSTAVIAPGILESFGPTGLADTILVSFLIFCLSLYKRRIEKKHLLLINKQKKHLEVKTFGNFTIMYEG
ncbi:MAG: hypothetical protein K6E78_06625, partial [Treponema sp.]|nr:hypothetical protein [Treponema sp.]